MRYDSVKSVAQAQQMLAQNDAVVKTVEAVSIGEAVGRIAASPIKSPIDSPPQDNSAMDGVAISCSELRQFRISQRIPAGLAPQSLSPQTAARIFTGGVIPEGADAVVIQEQCDFSIPGTVRILNDPKPGDNIRPRGQDIAAGTTIIDQGQSLTPIDIALLSSVGIGEISVFKRLKVAVLSTGDELVEPGQALIPGQIYNSNRILISLLAKSLGCDVLDIGRVADTFEATRSALEQAAQSADLIISTGGVSVGEEDHVRPAVESLGKLTFWKINMKPGKPVAVGKIGNSQILGLPGNPVSSFVVFQLLGVPLIKALQGAHSELPKPISVPAAFAKAAGTREEYVRVKLEHDENGRARAVLFSNLSSGVLSSLSWADGLVKQSPDHAIQVGDLVDFYALRSSSLW